MYPSRERFYVDVIGRWKFKPFPPNVAHTYPPNLQSHLPPSPPPRAISVIGGRGILLTVMYILTAIYVRIFYEKLKNHTN